MFKLTHEKLVFLFFLLFFIVVPNNDQGFDSYAFLIDARDGLDIVHPHHLLYNVFRYILYQLSTQIGLDPMRVISLASSVIGALSLMLIFKFLRRRTLPEIALTGTMIIGMVYSFWYYSTSVEVNIVSIFSLILSFHYLTHQRSDRNSFLAFLFLSVGILFHQLLILALIPMLIYDACRYGSFGRTIKLSMISLVPGFAIYMIVAFAASDGRVSGAFAWLFKYPELGRWGTIHSGSVIASAGGIVKAIFGGSMLRQSLYGSGLSFLEMLYLVGAGISICGLLVVLVYSMKNITWLQNAEALFLLGTSIIFIIFAFWWAPSDGGFWFYPIVLILLMVFENLSHSEFTRGVTYAVLIIFALVNIAGAFGPSSKIKNSVARTGAAALVKLKLDQNDLVLTNMAQIKLALEYHYNIKVPINSVAYLPKGPKDDVIARYRSMISNFDGKVIIFENEIYPESHRRFLFGRFSKSEYTEVYKPFMPYLQPVDSIQVYGKWITLFELEKEPETE